MAGARRLQRRRAREAARRFLVEGPQAVREAGPRVEELFATPEALRRFADVVAGVAGRVTAVEPDALAGLAETVHPQGLVGVCAYVDVPLGRALAPRPALVAVLVEAQDPGNAGTVVRTADAAGAGAVLLTPGSVDLYNGKCVRATAGSLFHLDLATGVHLAEAASAARAAGMRLLAADGDGDVDLDDAADSGLLAAPTAWLFGNEPRGLPAEALRLADAAVRVPLHGRAESLNLAVAAGVCLYASARAHRETAGRG